MNSTPKVLLGALAGAATGALLTGLFATEKGDKYAESCIEIVSM